MRTAEGVGAWPGAVPIILPARLLGLRTADWGPHQRKDRGGNVPPPRFFVPQAPYAAGASASACTGASSCAVAPLARAALTAVCTRAAMPLMRITAEDMTVVALVTSASRLVRIADAIVRFSY